MTRAIILCAGEATRWQNYLNTPKHLIEIEGEKILHRTVRLLKENGVEDIYIVSKDDPRYKIEGTEQYLATLNYEENADADKFLSSKELWNQKGRTIVIYGDCYFTEDAIKTIVSFQPQEWTLFCRPTASNVTGTKWGECFAQSFYPEHIATHEEMLHYIAHLWKTGIITRCGGWEHYRAMGGKRGEKVRRPHVMTTNYVVIDDFTEDFDKPEELQEWLRRRNRGKIMSNDR